MSDDRVEAAGGLTRYPRRGLAVLALAILFGPFIGTLCVTLFDAGLTLQEKGAAGAWKYLTYMFPGVLAVGYSFGGVIALLVGSILALIVWRDGNVSFWKTALVAFLVPFAPLYLMGPAGWIFGLSYSVPAVLAALVVHGVGVLVAKQFGVPV